MKMIKTSGVELVKSSLECQNLAELAAWAEEFEDVELNWWALTLWEQRKAGTTRAQVIVGLSAAISVGAFVLSVAAAVCTGILRLAGIL